MNESNNRLSLIKIEWVLLKSTVRNLIDSLSLCKAFVRLSINASVCFLSYFSDLTFVLILRGGYLRSPKGYTFSVGDARATVVC
jgi:hypothetical protein